eukprot:m.32475 g.32475  ORF g.32475 m.32475 type:complete len:488 (-) comp8416_c0_seq1:70-1533(-)
MAPKLVPSQTKPTDPSINASEKRALLQQTNLAYDGGEEMPEAMDETPCRINYCTLCLVMVTGFVAAVEYAMLMPTVWSYLKEVNADRQFLGVTLAAFALGRLVFFVPMGTWSDKHCMRAPFVTCCVLQVIGNLMYGSAGYFGSKYMILFGRFIVGLGASNTTLTTSYISRSIPPRLQTRMFSIQTGINLFGAVIGPAINALIVHLNWKEGILFLNERTIAGYGMVPLNIILLILYLVVFLEPREKTPHDMLAAKEIRRRNRHRHWVGVLAHNGMWWGLQVIFCVGFLLSSIETIITPLTKEQYNWGTMENSILFACVAVVALLSVLTTIIVDKLCGLQVRYFCVAGLSILVGSLVFSLILNGGETIPKWSLLAYGGSFLYGLVMLGVSSSGIYSIRAAGRNKGFYLSLVQVFQCIGRFLGPIVAGGTMGHSEHYLYFSVCLGVALSSSFGLGHVWRKLDVRKLTHNSPENIIATEEDTDVLLIDEEP